jgi:aspartate/methionine/tyrosine aminotransferase
MGNLPKLPWKPIISEGGYFVIFDITDCIVLIPELYTKTHDFEEGVCKYRLNMPGDGRIPYDLAFTRWMAVEYGVVMIPLSFFYQVGSVKTKDNFVRLSIGKLPLSIEKCVERLKE